MPPTPSTSNSTILTMLEGLRCDIAELKATIAEIANNYQTFRIDYTRAHADVDNSAKAAHKRLDDHEKRIEKVEETVGKIDKKLESIGGNLKIILWIFGIAGGSLLTWIAAKFLSLI